MKKLIFIVTLAIGISVFSSNVEAKYITLSGYLTLSGNIYVPSQNSYASGYVSGWVELRDYSGEYYTRNIYVNTYVSFWASSNYVYTTAYPYTYFTVYNKDGKAVGSGYINQGIGVSGFLSGNYVYLSGSSYISVSVNINED
ncbi:MAG: hypothetical protein N2Z20_03775 [Elusimicrobiales bacterium]|nr:hypothetical protein [Elusimicrobiales bacterium]